MKHVTFYMLRRDKHQNKYMKRTEEEDHYVTEMMKGIKELRHSFDADQNVEGYIKAVKEKYDLVIEAKMDKGSIKTTFIIEEINHTLDRRREFETLLSVQTGHI